MYIVALVAGDDLDKYDKQILEMNVDLSIEYDVLGRIRLIALMAASPLRLQFRGKS
ncbi:MAG: hypothetical protein GY950_02050 [bacterium]|nr:hypothetical protein [bacterium]